MAKTKTVIAKRDMTVEERNFQSATLKKHRKDGVVPSLQQISRSSGTAVSTAAMFLEGNSKNKEIRKYLRDRIPKNLVPVPDDIKRLFKIWDET